MIHNPIKMKSKSPKLLHWLYTAGLFFLVIYDGLLSVLTLGYVLFGLFYYLIKSFYAIDREPQLYFVTTPLSNHVIQNCKRLTEPFRPPYWARNAHIQTIGAVFLRSKKVDFKREYLNLSDGGVLALDHGISPTKSFAPSSPVLLLIPGINGDSDSVTYISGEAIARGFRPVVYNKRGFNGSHLATPKMLGVGDPADMDEVIQFLKRVCNPSDIVSVAYSAGSALLRCYIGKRGTASEISAAVCNSPGYKHKTLFNKLMQPYDYVMLKGYKEMLKKHQETLKKVIDVGAAFRTRRVIDFEEAVQGKISNCEDIDEYILHNEPDRCIQRSVTPFLCINSADDPVCLEELIPYEFFKQQPNAMLAVTAEGGHCAFMERGTWNRWADDVALDYIESVLQLKSMKKA